MELMRRARSERGITPTPVYGRAALEPGATLLCDTAAGHQLSVVNSSLTFEVANPRALGQASPSSPLSSSRTHHHNKAAHYTTVHPPLHHTTQLQQRLPFGYSTKCAHRDPSSLARCYRPSSPLCAQRLSPSSLPQPYHQAPPPPSQPAIVLSPPSSSPTPVPASFPSHRLSPLCKLCPLSLSSSSSSKCVTRLTEPSTSLRK